MSDGAMKIGFAPLADTLVASVAVGMFCITKGILTDKKSRHFCTSDSAIPLFQPSNRDQVVATMRVTVFELSHRHRMGDSDQR